MKLLINNPEPASNTIASAVWATTTKSPSPKRRMKKRRRLPWLTEGALSLSAPIRSGLEAWSAGANPKMMPTSTVVKNVNAITRPSRLTCASRGTSGGLSAIKPWTAQRATNNPHEPPINARKVLSVSNCRISRQRLAPSAARVAISRCLVDARARRRLATVAQAISRTKPTAPNRTSNAGRTLPTMVSCNGISSVSHSL